MQATNAPTKGSIGAVLIILLILGDTVMDVMGSVHTLHKLGISLTQSLGFLALVCVIMVAAFSAEPIMAKIYRSNASVVEPVRHIDPSILRRWDSLLAELGIDYDEPRAQITQFPDVLAQIEAAEMARLNCSVRSVRVELGKRVWTLMEEVLEPLAAELHYLEEVQEPAVTTAAKPSLTQHIDDAAAELMARSPI